MSGSKDRSFVFGLGATIASEAIGRGSALAFQFLVANQLGASLYGGVALALASAALLFPLADMGLQNLALKTSAADPTGSSTSSLLGMKGFFVPFYLVPLAIWALWAREPGDRLPLLWAGMFYLLQSIGDMFRQIYRGRSMTRVELVARIGMPVGNIASLVLVWFWRPEPAGALFALCLGPAALALSYAALLPKRDIRFSFSGKEIGLLRANLKLIVQSISYLAIVGFSTRIDAFVLQGCASTKEVGRYFAVLNFVMAGGFLAQGVSSYLYPRLHRQIDRRSRAFFRAAAIQTAVGTCMLAGIAIVGPLLFAKIFHAASYAGAQSLLPGMGAMLLCSTLDWLWLSVLLGKDKLWLTCVGLVPLLGSKLLFGPAWSARDGATGMMHAALLGSVATTAFGAVAAYFAFTRGGEAGN